MSAGNSILFFLAGLALAQSICFIILRNRRDASDKGRPREFHQTHSIPIPRIGGLGLAIPFSVIYLFCVLVPSSLWRPTHEEHVLVLASLGMFGLGLWDDFKALGAKRKLCGQIIIAALIWYFGLRIQEFKSPISGLTFDLGLWGFPLTLLWIVTFTNLINLIDGIDGLAGGVAIMLLGLLAYLNLERGASFSLTVCLGMIGAIIGFLHFNFPPASIHMGDGGAYFLGCLISLVSLASAHKGTVFGALIAPIIALGLPILDAFMTISRRALQGLPIFRADRKHLHHRLVDSGLDKTKALFVLYGLSSLFLLMALVAFLTHGRAIGILVGGCFVVVLFSLRFFKFTREWFDPLRIVRQHLLLRKETRYVLTLCRWLEMEAHLAHSFPALWADYCFLCKKLRYSRVVLHFRDGTDVQYVAPGGEKSEASGLISKRYDLPFGNLHAILFEANSTEVPLNQLEHVSELAVEALINALSHWQRRSRIPSKFSANTFKPGSTLDGSAPMNLPPLVEGDTTL